MSNGGKIKGSPIRDREIIEKVCSRGHFFVGNKVRKMEIGKNLRKKKEMRLHKLHEINRIIPIRVRNTLSFTPNMGADMIMIMVKGRVQSSIVISEDNKMRGVTMTRDNRI